MLTGIVSAQKNIAVRNDVATAGEIKILGKVLPVGGIQQKVRTAYDAGIKEVVPAAGNLEKALFMPTYITDGLKLTGVRSIQEIPDAGLRKS